MYKKTRKQGFALQHTIIQCAGKYGPENCRVATLTLSGSPPLWTIGKKLDVLFKQLKKRFEVIISVSVVRDGSPHVHMFLVLKPGSDAGSAMQFFKEAKSKAGFGRVFTFGPIVRTAEALAVYYKNNYYEVMEWKKGRPRHSRSKAVRMIGVPKGLKLRTNDFEIHGELQSRYRLVLSRIADVYGVEHGDWYNLSRRLGCGYGDARKIAFELVNTTPGKPQKWPDRHILDTVDTVLTSRVARTPLRKVEQPIMPCFLSSQSGSGGPPAEAA